MKAMVYHTYGSPEAFKLEDVVMPVPNAGEVLIKVQAASVNSWDWDLVRGKPFIVRLAGGGIRKPKLPILGADVAGTVEVVGKNVKQFKPGDAVLGDLCASGWGGFAEYVSVPETTLILKPSGVTFEAAAALPQAGVMALQGIRDYRKLQHGQKVLINGAAGGVGTYAIQLARLFGAEVTAVDRTDKLDFLKSLGADYVIDYTKVDFTQNGQHYDLILDVVATRGIRDYRRALLPGGIYLMIGGTTSTIFQFMVFSSIVSWVGERKLRILIHQPNKDLTFLAGLLQAGKIKSIIDRRYSLVEVPDALQRLGDGNSRGKIIIRIQP
jgi:NADPH:quinone reductase-like Zn-dependent oxidoreductase